jgi:predicted ATPase
MSPLNEREPAEAEIIGRVHSSLRKRQEQPPTATHITHHAASSSSPVGHTTFHHNLPAQLTPFIGRTEQITQLMHEVRAHRLLTLTGAGGVGKTRLALEVATRMLDWFVDGVWLIDLGPLSDPALLPQSILEVLQAPELPVRSPVAALTTYLAAKHLLLILDNCEHLIDAAASTAEEILRAYPEVHLLATSSEALHIGAEIRWRVASLTQPPPEFVVERPEAKVLDRATQTDGLRLSLADLGQYEAVALFVDRVRVFQPSFALSANNARAIAQICNRLDGIPLALEMAAAQADALTVEEIAARLSGALDARFQLLTGASRTAPRRQQTLRATLEWSYALLTPAEQRLLARMSVFAGGWTAEAAEAVCADREQPGILAHDVLPLLTQLVHKSLVIAEHHGGQTRYLMLETVRQFAVEKSGELGEVTAMRERHLAYARALAEPS